MLRMMMNCFLNEAIEAVRERENDIKAGRVRSLRDIMKDPGDDQAIRPLVK